MLSFSLVWLTVLAGIFFFFKQKTAYEISSRDWSSDVCSSDLTWYGGGRLRTRKCGPRRRASQIGRASCRERVCELVYISVVAVSSKKKKRKKKKINRLTKLNLEVIRV